MIRLFVGFEIPPPVRAELLRLQNHLPGAYWRTAERLHFTLSFIGDVREPDGEELLRELRFIRFPSFEMSLKGIGYFERAGIPHHLWIGVDADEALKALQLKVESAVRRVVDRTAERFKFFPHVSLARLQESTRDDVYGYIARNNLFCSSPFRLDSFALFQSIARESGEGKHYRVIENYPLTAS